MKKTYLAILVIMFVFGLNCCKEVEIPEGTFDKGPVITFEDLTFQSINGVNFDYVKKDANELEEVDFISFAELVFTYASENNSQGISPYSDQYADTTGIMRINYDHPDYESLSIHIYILNERLFDTEYTIYVNYKTDNEFLSLIYYQSFDEEIKEIIK